MIDVVILYDDGCPNVMLARAAVSEAARATALQVRVRELERADAPAELRGFASPTVLVEGRDVALGTACTGTACRMYAGPDGRLTGTPPFDEIVAALQRTQAPARAAAS